MRRIHPAVYSYNRMKNEFNHDCTKDEVLKVLINLLILIFKTAVLVFLYWAAFLLVSGRSLSHEGFFILAALCAHFVNPPAGK